MFLNLSAEVREVQHEVLELLHRNVADHSQAVSQVLIE